MQKESSKGGKSKDRKFCSPDHLTAQMNLFMMIKMAIQMNKSELLEPFVDKVDMRIYGSHLLQFAVAHNQANSAEFFIKRGISVQSPPDKLSPKMELDANTMQNYRQSPYIIQAACHGDMDLFKVLQAAGCKATETGFVALSRRRHNQVITNAIGAAAHYGNHKLLKQILVSRCEKDFPAQEKADNSKSAFAKEFTGYTPLMMVAANPCNGSVEAAKLLIAAGANVQAKDWCNSTVAMVAV